MIVNEYSFRGSKFIKLTREGKNGFQLEGNSFL